MGIPVKLSEELALRARLEAEASERSMTAQIEHWARLGAALEEVLGHRHALALKKAGMTIPLDRALSFAASAEGQDAALRHLAATSQPRYSIDPEDPQRVVRIEPDGHRTVGRFVNRRFVPDEG